MIMVFMWSPTPQNIPDENELRKSCYCYIVLKLKRTPSTKLFTQEKTKTPHSTSPLNLNDSTVGLGCAFNICFSFSSSSTKYLWEAIGIPYTAFHSKVINKRMCDSLKCFPAEYILYIYTLSKTANGLQMVNMWHGTDIQNHRHVQTQTYNCFGAFSLIFLLLYVCLNTRLKGTGSIKISLSE